MGFFSKIFGKKPKPLTSIDDLKAFSHAANRAWTGEKFFGGFGETQLFELDYWTLRTRSSQLFTSNLYARGMIRRLVTNIINVGLTLEAVPEESILGLPEDSLLDWTDTVENRFSLWTKTPQLCDHKRLQTFGKIQKEVEQEALVEGDILVILNFSKGSPNVQLVRGGNVRDPIKYKLRKGNRIKHGVELDSQGRQVAYHIDDQDGKSKRIPAYGEKTHRRIAWLVYGSDKRTDEVRGTPILSLILQSLKEIDRYRDSTQRKAVINSMLAIFVQKDGDKPGTLPLSGGAVRKDTVEVTDGDGSTRDFNINKNIPGMVIEELQTGEKPVGFNNQGIDTAFGEFESAILRAVAWANEIPPEILELSFKSNYSASQAAINEFKIYLDSARLDFGEAFNQPIYIEWLVNEVLQGKIKATGLLSAWRNKNEQTKFAAWVSAEWMGAIKVSSDPKKMATAYEMQVKNGWTTNTKVARETSSTKFIKNIKKLKIENELIAEASIPRLRIEAEFGTEAAAKVFDKGADHGSESSL